VDAALREAVVAIDANVLLNLYRYRAQTSRDLIKVLESLGDRLVVPHQALPEFWRHRQRSQASPQAATNTALESVVKATRAVKQALEGWAKQVGVDAEELRELTALVGGFEQEMDRAVREVLEDVGGRAEGDYILDHLERLLEGRVTDALATEDWELCVAEARRRIEAEEPPGFKDADKEDGESLEGGAGDYLVWYQATRHAQARKSDLVLVTADEKEDWWWRQQSRFIGPRPELVLEYYLLGGRRLFLLRPSDLLAKASALQVEVNEESSADADRAVDEEIATPWTLGALEAVLEHLDREAPVQAAALRLATPEHGGQVSRDAVYELGSYSDDRMLRGFTRPVRRLTELLQDGGIVPAGVPPLLVARYPDGVKASYFGVPAEVPQLLKELALSQASSARERPADVRGHEQDER
jgi:predicted nucleic acid-binding protein